MAANYLHGVETIEIETGPRPVKAVKSAVIALIGTAPCGPVNKPTLCLSESDAAQFGSTQTNFTIPQALKAIYDHGAGTVVVINVLDPAKHGSNISNESITFDANNQAKATFDLAKNLADGKGAADGTNWKIDNKVVRVPYVGVDKDNLAEFSKK